MMRWCRDRYLLYLHFEKTALVKPLTSRPANSERYLVCIGLRCAPTSRVAARAAPAFASRNSHLASPAFVCRNSFCPSQLLHLSALPTSAALGACLACIRALGFVMCASLLGGGSERRPALVDFLLHINTLLDDSTADQRQYAQPPSRGPHMSHFREVGVPKSCRRAGVGRSG